MNIPEQLRIAAESFQVEILDLIVKGGQKDVAVVRRGADHHVLKVVTPNGPSADDTRARAYREVAALAAVLGCENVVELTGEAVELANPPKSVAWMERFVPGSDLADHLADLWGWDDAIEMGIEVAKGIAGFHENGIVHRDLSPNNVRVTSNGGFVVLDPGLGRHIDLETLTGNHLVVGTLGSMSPEHVGLVTRPTPASDVYCVGLLLFRCLSGESATPIGADLLGYVENLRRQRRTPITRLRADAPAGAAALIDRLLHRQAARRPKDGRELQRLLEDL